MTRITKIICPHCEGTEVADSTYRVIGEAIQRVVPCPICSGVRRVSFEQARAYADNLYTCAVGGYAVGDIDQKEKDRLTKKATDVFRLLGEMPPWLRTAA